MNYEVLINKNNKVAEDSFKDRVLLEIINVEDQKIFVEEKTLKQFRLLEEEQNKKGIKVGIDEAYRSAEQQQKVYKRIGAKYGIDYANKIVAPVGTSEHQSGLALDISIFVNGNFLIDNNELMENEEKFLEIHKILHKYGFILRYPKGKEEITGYPYEPWHIRYIGKELATKLYNEDITLEEYYNGKSF